MNAVVAALVPWWEYISIRCVLRLCAACSDLWAHLLPLLLEWAGTHVCFCGWKKLSLSPSSTVGRELVHLRSGSRPKDSIYQSAKNVIYVHNKCCYVAIRPKLSVISRRLRTKVCRECLQPSTRKAYTKSGRFVVICKACSMDPLSYSSMCDRRMLIQLNHGMRNYNQLLHKLHVCKIGGNRAFLYWRADVEHLLQSF